MFFVSIFFQNDEVEEFSATHVAPPSAAFEYWTVFSYDKEHNYSYFFRQDHVKGVVFKEEKGGDEDGSVRISEVPDLRSEHPNESTYRDVPSL